MVRAVLAELERGPCTTEELARRVGTSPAAVSAIVEQLARLGRLDVSRVPACGGSCGACGAATRCALRPQPPG